MYNLFRKNLGKVMETYREQGKVRNYCFVSEDPNGEDEKLEMYVAGDDRSVIRMNVQDLYDNYAAECSVCYRLVEGYMQMLMEKLPVDASFIPETFEAAKDRLVIRLLHCGENESWYENSVCRKIGDVAAVVYYLMDDTDLRCVSFKLPKVFCRRWNISEKALLEYAAENTAVKYPAVFNDDLPEYIASGSFVTLDEIRTHVFDNGSDLILSNEKRVNGISAIAYPGMLKTLAELLKGSYYFVFIDTDDVHVVGSEKFSHEVLQEFLDEVNEQYPDDMVSECVYMYDAEEDRVSVCQMMA